MKSKFFAHVGFVVLTSFMAASAFAQEASVEGEGHFVDPSAAAPLPPPAEWALRSSLAVGPTVDVLGAVGAFDVDLAYRPRSVPMVFRVESIPAALALTEDGSLYAGYGRALVGLSLDYVEVALGGGVATDGFYEGEGARDANGLVSIDARVGRLDGTHVSLFADAAIATSEEAFGFGRAGAVVQVALPKKWTLRVDAELNRAGLIRGQVGARNWLRGAGEAGSFALGAKLGYLGVLDSIDIDIFDTDPARHSAGGPVVGIDVEYRF